MVAFSCMHITTPDSSLSKPLTAYRSCNQMSSLCLEVSTLPVTQFHDLRSAWVPLTVTHHRAWHTRGSGRPHISLQRDRKHINSYCCHILLFAFSLAFAYPENQEDLLCVPSHISASCLDILLLWSVLEEQPILVEDVRFFFIFSYQCSVLTGCSVRFVISTHCFINSTGPPFLGYQV